MSVVNNRKLRIVSLLVKNRRATKQLQLLKEKGYTIMDVTSKSETHAYLSPFFPQGGITVGKFVSESVEGLYQGLKVFEEVGIDETKFRIRNMKNLKRTVRSCGKVKGHHNPLLACGHRAVSLPDETGALLDYVSARLHIYIPAYEQVLRKHRVELCAIRERLLVGEKICLVDYNTNEFVLDTRSPLSHAALIIQYLLQSPKIQHDLRLFRSIGRDYDAKLMTETKLTEEMEEIELLCGECVVNGVTYLIDNDQNLYNHVTFVYVRNLHYDT